MKNATQELERRTADELAASFTRTPSAWKWRDGSCDVVCGPGHITMSANYFTIYSPGIVRFGFWNRRRIRRAFKRWKRLVGNDLTKSAHHRSLLALRQCLAEPLRAVA